MSNIKIFELTQKILEESEAYILNHTSQTKLGFWFSRHILFPGKFLAKGSEDFFKPFAKWAFLSFVLLALGTYIINHANFPSEIKSLIFSISLYVPMALIMFSVPSTYAYYGVTSKNVDDVVLYLETLKIKEIETIECLQANLEIVDSRIRKRISMYKWLIASTWAVFTLILNQQMNVALKMQPKAWHTVLQENLSSLIVFITITLIAIWIITSYKKASELVIKTIEFGLIEIKHKIYMNKMT